MCLCLLFVCIFAGGSTVGVSFFCGEFSGVSSINFPYQKCWVFHKFVWREKGKGTWRQTKKRIHPENQQLEPKNHLPSTSTTLGFQSLIFEGNDWERNTRSVQISDLLNPFIPGIAPRPSSYQTNIVHAIHEYVGKSHTHAYIYIYIR